MIYYSRQLICAKYAQFIEFKVAIFNKYLNLLIIKQNKSI